MSESKILTESEIARIETRPVRAIQMGTPLVELTVAERDALCATVRQLMEENERLKRGDFTIEEFQSFCHNTDIQAGFDAFADGCEAYQQKMFGRCRTEGKVL